MSALLRLDNATVRFGRVAALRGASMAVDAGERIAFIGANGSGKSTLLRVLHGLVAPGSGELTRTREHTQAMVFQRPFMLRASTRFNVALGLWLRGAAWAQANARARDALQRVGLEAVGERNARDLSGGQQQRVALARAWAMRPDLLLLDEPTSSLDPHAKREVEALIAQFAADGTTLLFASHNLGQVKRLATRVVYLEQGAILADLPVRDFFGGPLAQVSREADLFVKGELG